MFRFLVRVLGRLVGVVAWFFVGLGLLFTLWFFYAEDRLLFLFPGLAEEVELAQLLENRAQYDDRWVSVRGRLWNQKHHSAILVPETAGGENWTREEFRELVSEHSRDETFSADKPLPDEHVSLLGPGWKASRAVGFFHEGPVTVLGEFELPGMIDDRPRIYVGGIVEERGDAWTWFAIVMHGLIYVAVTGFGFVLLYMAGAIRKAAQAEQSEDSNSHGTPPGG